MYIHKIIKANDQAIKILEKEGYELCTIHDNKMYFKKEVRNKKKIEQIEKTKELQEFIDMYKTIKNSGLSNKNMHKKYIKLCNEGKHTQIIENLVQYKKYLEVNKIELKHRLMAQSYINQSRFEDEWLIVQDHSKKFLDNMLKDLDKDIIENILTEISYWETKNKPRELTPGTAENIIKYVLSNGK